MKKRLLFYFSFITSCYSLLHDVLKIFLKRVMNQKISQEKQDCISNKMPPVFKMSLSGIKKQDYQGT